MAGACIEEGCNGPSLARSLCRRHYSARRSNRIENLELWTVSQPSWQRVEDKVAWALEILRIYAPETLANGSS